MAKKMFFVSFLFLLMMSILLAFQWLSYQQDTTQSDAASQTKPLAYTITIDHQHENMLHVEQVVSGLEQQVYTFEMPASIQNFTCQATDGTNCLIEDKAGEVKEITVAESNKLTFTYDVLLSATENILIEQWHIALRDEKELPIVADFSVMAFEKWKQENEWIAGAALAEKIEYDTFTTYAWEKEEALNFPLYINKNRMVFENIRDIVTVYSAKPLETEIALDLIEDKISERSGLTLVLSEEKHKQVAPLLAVMPITSSNDEIGQAIVESLLYHTKQPENEADKWLWSALAKIITKQMDGDSKAAKMAAEISEYLTEEMYIAFTDWLLSSAHGEAPDLISAADIDRQLSQLIGWNTRFFEKNQRSDEPLVPLYFELDWKVNVNNSYRNETWKIYVQDDTYFLPIESIAAHFEIEITTLLSENALLVKQGTRSWRLYVDEQYFILNEESYGLSAAPLRLFENNIYISEQFVEDMLKIDVIKRENLIKLQG